MNMKACILVSAILIGCGGDEGGNETGPAAPTCTGASCECPSGTACAFTESSCGEGSCSLDCANDNVCTGACAESCSIDCSGGSTCTVTVGPSGSVSCDGSTCHVTCTGSCSVSCTGEAACDLKCAGDAEARPISDGGQCS
jgi:hypothetical protein